ncbi:hypothetical protein WA158_005373 [Blastocystis sp. Blastoise]
MTFLYAFACLFVGTITLLGIVAIVAKLFYHPQKFKDDSLVSIGDPEQLKQFRPMSPPGYFQNHPVHDNIVVNRQRRNEANDKLFVRNSPLFDPIRKQPNERYNHSPLAISDTPNANQPLPFNPYVNNPNDMYGNLVQNDIPYDPQIPIEPPPMEYNAMIIDNEIKNHILYNQNRNIRIGFNRNMPFPVIINNNDRAVNINNYNKSDNVNNNNNEVNMNNPKENQERTDDHLQDNVVIAPNPLQSPKSDDHEEHKPPMMHNPFVKQRYQSESDLTDHVPEKQENQKNAYNPFVRRPPPVGVQADDAVKAEAPVVLRYTRINSPNAAIPQNEQPEFSLPPEFAIPWEELEVGDSIGEGAYGRVYKGRWRGTPVAIKVLNCHVGSDIVQDFQLEVGILASLRHPNIVLFLSACVTPPHLCLVSELASRGSLWDVLHTDAIPLSTRLKVQIALDIAYGMAYLHTRKPVLLHRDLKSANILLDVAFRAKITDFGLARVKARTETMTGNCGTYQWMAPEVLDNKRYTEKADIYSFGILIWELYTRKLPYEGKSGIQAAVSVLKRGLRPPIPQDCPQEYIQIMTQCWQTNPELRPSFPVIIQKLEKLSLDINSNSN